jgi:hypothetical protein
MKYYETNYEEYLSSYENYNIHPELLDIKSKFPKNISEFHNLIVYGASGVGKYTQVLTILQPYSPSKLKYDKKISVTYEKQEKKTKTPSKTNMSSFSSIKEKVKEKEKESNNNTKKKTLDVIPIKKTEKKQEYIYRISDIHYEIDMATLGCNSKLLWHDLFFQINDIISVSFHSQDKTDKVGIIVCKNFHAIHNELLDIFYSYMRHPLHPFHIQIKFILLTEHVSFIPNNIVNACKTISISRPSKFQYMNIGFSSYISTLTSINLYTSDLYGINRTLFFNLLGPGTLIRMLPTNSSTEYIFQINTTTSCC